MNPVRVAQDVFSASGTTVNWVLLRDGGDLTLIDGPGAPWPGPRGRRAGPRHRLTSPAISRPVDGGIHPPAR
jgi:hypothetical protein